MKLTTDKKISLYAFVFSLWRKTQTRSNWRKVKNLICSKFLLFFKIFWQHVIFEIFPYLFQILGYWHFGFHNINWPKSEISVYWHLGLKTCMLHHIHIYIYIYISSIYLLYETRYALFLGLQTNTKYVWIFILILAPLGRFYWIRWNLANSKNFGIKPLGAKFIQI